MTDPVPMRPLLAPWYRLVGDGDRLLLEHGQSVVVLEGGAVRALLPALLPILDGTRTIEDLSSRLGVAARPAIELALDRLMSHGLLLEGPDAPPERRSAAHAVAAAFDLTPAVAAARLAGATVGVVGASPTGAEVARLLQLAAIGDVRRLSWRGDRPVDLAVLAPAWDEGDALPGWNELALDRGIRWLPVLGHDGRTASVGPLVVPGESCCHRCVVLRRAANVEYGDELAEIDVAPLAARADAGIEALVVGLAAHLVVRWLGGRDTTLAGVLHLLEAHRSVSLSEHFVLRVPRCDACSPTRRVAPPLPWHEATA